MPADNSLYETLDDWWDPTGSVAGLHAMNPARSRYVLDVLRNHLGPPEDRLCILDLGCGGGLLTETLVRAGWRVVGADAAFGALRCASTHARAQGLAPSYVDSLAERLPFADSSFAAVVSSDFLEHVSDLASVVRECARVLAPGGVFVYDTINRTWLTRLFHIGVLQEWKKLVPKDTHDWRQFIKPHELSKALRAAGLEPVEVRGLSPVNPIRFALHLLFRRTGKEPMPPFRVSSWLSGSYLGYAARARQGTDPTAAGRRRSSGRRD